VSAAATNDEDAWTSLVHRFAGLVSSVAQGYRLNHADAADVAQATWLRLTEHISRLEQPERVGSWLVRTAQRECLAHIRRSQREVPSDDTYFLDLADAELETEPGSELLQLELEADLRRALQELPERSRLLLEFLFADRSRNYKDIARATGLKPGSIGPTRARCLAQLREHMDRRRSGRSIPEAS
jgi:RNA polymerase sigma factor (sigma-70 family)